MVINRRKTMSNFLVWFKEFFFGIESKVEAKVEEEVKKIEEEVKTVKKKVKEKLDVNKDGKVTIKDGEEVVKKVIRKKKA
ncbi:hypothetical protein UFOVP247_57 [uncultured Caudovirales phage]|uniref:Uncharacterized protein n=1 Tax=uncultured Caudovirales phage TaxID=2100421 RepID=A0A6J7WW56_9CAUD|nr:hypothetical protein UFOVP247_57 [uncultured Caudovirales phage]